MREPFDAEAVLRDALARHDLAYAVRRAAPALPQYERLREALARYRSLAGDPAWSTPLPGLPAHRIHARPRPARLGDARVKRLLAATLALLAAVATAPRARTPMPSEVALSATAPDSFLAEFTTTKGRFVMKARRAWSPLGVDRLHALVRAGYFDEPDDLVGIAHVLEHMYFKGTSTRGVGATPVRWVSSTTARSSSRTFSRRPRGRKSLRRSSSRIAPRMRL